MAGIFQTGSVGSFAPYHYGPHLHNTMYHWDPNPASEPTNGCAWVLFRYGGGFRAGHAGLQAPVFFSSMSAESDTFPVHMYSIDCRESQQQFDQLQFDRKKMSTYPGTVEDGVDDWNLAFQYVIEERAALDNLNVNLGGSAGTSSGAVTGAAAGLLPEASRYRGIWPYQYPHSVRPPWLAMAEVPWNARWLRGSTGMDYAFVETAHDPNFLTDGQRDTAYEALGNRLNMFNNYDNILTVGYEPYICSLYLNNTHGALPADFQLADPHDARSGYYFHLRLANDLGYSPDKHKLIVTGTPYTAPAADWWQASANGTAAAVAQWAWVKATIIALAGGTYP